MTPLCDSEMNEVETIYTITFSWTFQPITSWISLIILWITWDWNPYLLFFDVFLDTNSLWIFRFILCWLFYTQFPSWLFKNLPFDSWRPLILMILNALKKQPPSKRKSLKHCTIGLKWFLSNIHIIMQLYLHYFSKIFLPS